MMMPWIPSVNSRAAENESHSGVKKPKREAKSNTTALESGHLESGLLSRLLSWEDTIHNTHGEDAARLGSEIHEVRFKLRESIVRLTSVLSSSADALMSRRSTPTHYGNYKICALSAKSSLCLIGLRTSQWIAGTSLAMVARPLYMEDI